MIFKISRTKTGIVIDAVEEKLTDGTEISSGFIFLDKTIDLFRLRDSIDAYITRNNLTPTSK